MTGHKISPLLFVFSRSEDPLRRIARESRRMAHDMRDALPDRMREEDAAMAISFACNRGMKFRRGLVEDAFKHAVLEVLGDMASYCMGVAMRSFAGNEFLERYGTASMRDQDWGTFYDICRRNGMRDKAARLDEASGGGLSRMWSGFKEAVYRTADFRERQCREFGIRPRQSAYDEIISRMFIGPGTWAAERSSGLCVLDNVDAAHRYGLDATSRFMAKEISGLLDSIEEARGECRILHFPELPSKWPYLEAPFPSSFSLISRLTLDHVRPFLEGAGTYYV